MSKTITKNSIKVPKSFELHAITYTVLDAPNLVFTSENIGEAHFRTSTILIQPNVAGVPRTSEQLEQVFFHELVHTVLYEMGNDLKHDETFVDNFASLLHQALATAKY